MAAFSNVGKAVHLGDARIWLKGTNGAIFSGALSPMALRWRFRGGSADTGRAPRAHRSRAKVERGIWVLFHVEIWRLMVADELADHQARPSPAVLRPVSSGFWAPGHSQPWAGSQHRVPRAQEVGAEERQPASKACLSIANLPGTGERNLMLHLQGPTPEAAGQRPTKLLYW